MPDGPASLLRELDDGVLVLTFNRPERANGWTYDLEDRYFAALADAAADPEVRVIVVTGAGTVFCPGMDLAALQASVAGERPVHVRGEHLFARRIPKPVIAAVNGAAAGVGFIQACACDLRFASSTAKLTTSFARRGLPAENGLSWLLPRLVGTSTAMDLLLSARVVLAAEALSMGLVDRVLPPDDLLPETLAYAKDLAASCSPAAMAAIKAQVNDDWERTADESRTRAIELVVDMRDAADVAEGVAAFTEKRAPSFAGLSRVVAPRMDDPR